MPDLMLLTSAGTVLVEGKLVRGAGRAGHVEDLVVDASVRRMGLGSRIVAALVQHAQAQHCYKATACIHAHRLIDCNR